MNKIVILSFLVLSMFASCSGKKNTANSGDSSLEKDMIKLTEQQQSLAGIATSPLERTINPEVIHCNGVIEIPSDARVSMYLPIGGYVSEIYVLTGDKVKKGEVLAVLEHPDYIALQQQYIESHAQMLFYQSEWERQQKLQVENATMQRTLDKAKADYLGALSQTKALESKMEMLGMNTETLLTGKVSNKVYLRSPVNGFVGNVYINTGKYVTPTEELLTVLGTDHLHVELQIFEKDIARVHEGQDVVFTVTGSDSEYKAHVKLIGKEVDPTTRTVNVHAHIDAHYPDLITGMYAHAVVLVTSDSAYVLPTTAVKEENGRNFAWIEDSPGIYRKIEIRIGSEHNDKIAVLPTEDQKNHSFVIKGAYSLFAEEKKQGED